ncbi:MAG: hypothetical protein ACREK8_06445, partial [Gemmatimonadales bacterium]
MSIEADLLDPRASMVEPASVAVAHVPAVTATLWLIVITGVLRIAAAGSVGLGIGESYYFGAARHLSLSYFDQPPAAAFFAGLS